mmetsp:Transcript_26198/g.90031  ORF Transcript_26198/g.90031 Transcript_26198/m.90031 type:complete len:251 (+) Transcript_26198:682-1434(+)
MWSTPWPPLWCAAAPPATTRSRRRRRSTRRRTRTWPFRAWRARPRGACCAGGGRSAHGDTTPRKPHRPSPTTTPRTRRRGRAPRATAFRGAGRARRACRSRTTTARRRAACPACLPRALPTTHSSPAWPRASRTLRRASRTCAFPTTTAKSAKSAGRSSASKTWPKSSCFTIQSSPWPKSFAPGLRRSIFCTSAQCSTRRRWESGSRRPSSSSTATAPRPRQSAATKYTIQQTAPLSGSYPFRRSGGRAF